MTLNNWKVTDILTLKSLWTYLKCAIRLVVEGKPLLLSAAKGNFLNVVGLISRKNDLFFQILESTFNTDKIIDFLISFVEQINNGNI